MRFEKVSFEAFYGDLVKFGTKNSISEEDARTAWENIKMPVRGTEFAAGYDVCTPIDIVIPSNTCICVPTGIRAVFNKEELKTRFLKMFVRSSIGIKDHVVLTNGTGIIDSDYQFVKNKGDMTLALYNMSPNLVKYKAGDRICQAIIESYYLADNDTFLGKRTGGIGSTNK